MNVTAHAAARWAERFPGRDLALTYRRSLGSRVGAKLRRRIQASCPAHAHLLTGGFQGTYYAVTPDLVVFVMRPGETIVTVFQLQLDTGKILRHTANR